ncbi:MAG: acyltransferase [Planctomycetes bacterium]|nr:acyltransferase [Planctomycetota bacterium]
MSEPELSRDPVLPGEENGSRGDEARPRSWPVRAYWWIAAECRTWYQGFLQRIPGELGVFVRRRLLARRFARCGKLPYILEGCRFMNPHLLELGDRVRMSQGVVINAGGGVRIGDCVGIGPSVKIWSVNHRYDRLDVPIYAQGWVQAPVVIEDDVWLAANCFVKPGVTIGRGSVLSAGTVLAKSVRPFSLVAGNPGRVVGYRVDREEYFKSSLDENGSPEDANGEP